MTLLTHEYTLVCVSRTPTEFGSPIFVELGEVVPAGTGGRGGTGLGWGLELKGDGYISVATDPRKLPPGMGARLLNMKKFPLELWLWRDGVIVMRGPIIAWQVEGTTLVLTARGMLYYARYMSIFNNRNYDAVDVSAIVEDMIEVHRSRIWGDYGLLGDALPGTGKIVTRHYLKTDLVNVYNEIQELGKQAGGYDLTVNYGTGELQLWSYLNPDPGYGADKRDTVFLDFRGISNVNYSYSLAAGSFGSAVLAVGGEFSTDDEVIDGASRSQFGLAHVTLRITRGITSNAELNSHALDELARARTGIFVPSKDYVAFDGVSPVDDIKQGDIVTFVYDGGFGEVRHALQILNLNISVKAGGLEHMNIEFGHEVLSGGGCCS